MNIAEIMIAVFALQGSTNRHATPPRDWAAPHPASRGEGKAKSMLPIANASNRQMLRIDASHDVCHVGNEITKVPWQRSRSEVLAQAPLLHARGSCKGKGQDCSLALSPLVSSVALACMPLLEARVVAWFGGPPGSGKSTLALRATQYGFLSADCEPDPSGKDWLAQFGDTKGLKRRSALANATIVALHTPWLSATLAKATTTGMVVGSCYGTWLPSSPAHVMRVLLLPEQSVYAARHRQRGSTGWSTDGWRHASRSFDQSLLVWQADNETSIVRIHDRPNETSCPDKSLIDACNGIMSHLKREPDDLCFYCQRTKPPESSFWLLHCPPNCLNRQRRLAADSRGLQERPNQQMDLEHALTHGELQTPCASIGKNMKQALRKMSTLYDLPACDAARVDHAPLPLHRLIETSKLRGQAPAAVLLDVRRSGVTASFRPKSSIIMVVHNAGPALKLSLPRLFNQTFGCAELLLLLDQCSDDSIEIIASNLDKWFTSSRLRRVRVLEQSTPIWEAAAENLLMSVSNPLESYILIQPDHILEHPGWDLQLARPLAEYRDVVGVTGYLAHAFGAATPTLRHLRGRPLIRDFDHREVKSNLLNDSDIFHVRDTGSRGPLLLHAEKVQQLGFLDHELFWLEDSDHDLFCRASASRNWVVGAVQLHSSATIRGLKTKKYGEQRAKFSAQNESKVMLKRISQRATAVRAIRSSQVGGWSDCLHRPQVVKSLLRIAPRIETRPLAPQAAFLPREC